MPISSCSWIIGRLFQLSCSNFMLSIVNVAGSPSQLSFAQICARTPAPTFASAVVANTWLHAPSQCKPGTKTNWNELPEKSKQLIKNLISNTSLWNRENGAHFGNYEQLLPIMPPNGYYRKLAPYPVTNWRFGGHRIVIGCKDNEIHTIDYTKDHYQSFYAVWHADRPTAQAKPHHQPTTPTKPQ